MQGLGGDGIGDERGDHFAGGWVRGVRLDDHGASCGQGGSGVSARDGEGEGEVAGAEDGDGTQRPQHGADVGAWERLAIGECGVDAGVDPGTFLHNRGEEAQLVAGAAYFAGQARHGEGGFEVGALGQFLLVGVEGVGDAAEKGGPFRARELAVKSESSRGLAGGLVGVCNAGGVVRRGQLLAGGGVLGMEGDTRLGAAMSAEKGCAG